MIFNRILDVAEKPEKFSLLPKIINGGLAGIIGILCVYPLDLVKTRLQNSINSRKIKKEKMYRNMFDCFLKTYQREGFLGLYKGCIFNLSLITPETAIKLASNDYFRYHLTPEEGKIRMRNQVIAGSLAGFLEISLTTPMDLLKIQLQDAGRVAQQEHTIEQKVSAIQMIRQLWQRKGILGFYKGYSATFLRDVPFAMIYFPLFAELHDFYSNNNTEEDEEVLLRWSFIAGVVAGGFTAFSVTPFDVIKTRMQTMKRAKGEKEFNGVWDCATKIWIDEGFLAFFKGGLCRIIVTAPLFGLFQLVYYLGVGEQFLDYIGYEYD